MKIYSFCIIFQCIAQHCTFTIEFIHLSFILFTYFLYIDYILHTYCLDIVCVLFTYCLHIVHILFSYCLHIVYILFTYCLLIIYILFTNCLLYRFLVSACYSKAKVAAAGAGIVYFLRYVPYMYIAIREVAAGDKISAFVKT